MKLPINFTRELIDRNGDDYVQLHATVRFCDIREMSYDAGSHIEEDKEQLRQEMQHLVYGEIEDGLIELRHRVSREGDPDTYFLLDKLLDKCRGNE